MAEKRFIKDSDFKKLDVKGNDFYKKNSFNYPDSNIAIDKKGHEYFRGWAEKIYHLCLSGKTWMPLSDFNSIDVMRAYADGRQPTGQYKDWILGSWGVKSTSAEPAPVNASGWDIRDEASSTKKREAWSNINAQPVSVAPKIISKINEHIRSMYYEMGVKAIDSYSVETEQMAKYKLWFETKNRKWLDAQYALIGIEQEEPIFQPKNLNELELYALTGGFKVPYAISMEDLIKHTFEVSDMDKEVNERVRKDLITLGYTIAREGFDREKQRVIVKYANPKFSGIQYSDTGSFKDSEFAYTMEWMEVSKVRQRLNLDEYQAAALAYAYSDQFNNPAVSAWDSYGNMTGDSSVFGFDFYKVPVFSFEFIDIDNEPYLRFENKQGRTITKPYNGTIQDNEELKSHERRLVRQGKWIVGTQHLFDYGEKEYIPRDEFNSPRLSYRAVKLVTAPIMEQIKPFLDGFNLAWIKLQDFIAKAIGNGFAVDVGSLKDISVGKDKSFDPMQVLNFYRQSTFLLYKKEKSGLAGLSRSVSPPIIPITNNTYDNIKAQFETMNFFMQKTEDVTGLSMMSMGKSPEANVAKFNMQVSVQATNEIINNIARAQTDLQEDISINVCYRIRSLCRVNEFIRKSYEEVIGEQRMKAVVDADKNNVKYGITIEATDITEEKQFVMSMLQASIKQPGTEFAGLDISDAIIIQDMIMQRQNFRRIGLIIGYKMAEKERQARQQKVKMIELQGEQIKQPEMIKAQVQQQNQQFELQRLEKESALESQKIKEQFYYDYILKYTVPFGTPVPQQQTTTTGK
jgi:hypothetical protein